MTPNKDQVAQSPAPPRSTNREQVQTPAPPLPNNGVQCETNIADSTAGYSEAYDGMQRP